MTAHTCPDPRTCPEPSHLFDGFRPEALRALLDLVEETRANPRHAQARE